NRSPASPPGAWRPCSRNATLVVAGPPDDDYNRAVRDSGLSATSGRTMGEPTPLDDRLRQSIRRVRAAFGGSLVQLAVRLRPQIGAGEPAAEPTKEQLSYGKYLSKVELGTSALSLAHVDDVARVLGVPVSVFFALAERGRSGKWVGEYATAVERGKF